MSNYNIALLERLLKYEKDIQEMSTELRTLRGIIHDDQPAEHPNSGCPSSDPVTNVVNEKPYLGHNYKLPDLNQEDSHGLQLEMFDYGVLVTMTLTGLNEADKSNTIRFLKEKEFLKKAMDLFGGAQCPGDIQENALRTRYDSWIQHFRNLDYNIEYAAS